MKNRIGYKMKLTQEVAKDNPGIKLMELAQVVGPHGSLQFGYAIVHRAVSAGLVRLVSREDKAGCYRVFSK